MPMEREKVMSSRYSFLVTGVPLGIDAADADCFTKGQADARHKSTGRTQKRAIVNQRPPLREEAIRLEERHRERARLIHELHDTLLQGFLGASMLVQCAVEQTPPDSPSKPVLSRALRLVLRAIDEGRAAIRGVRRASPEPSSLEQTFSALFSEVTTGRGPRVRLFVQGKARTLNPAIQEQLFLIGREAVMNALRHSKATEIEVEVQYLGDLVHVFVRDNGCGINPEAIRQDSDSHWGLRGMRERAQKIGALLGIWSRPSAGTEVRIVAPVDYREAGNSCCGEGP
jgi:signal transduction histidine kinase